MDSEKDLQELLYLGMAMLGLVALKQVWTERIRPWIETTWGAIRADELASLPLIGPIDQADVIGVAALAVPFLVVLGVIATKMRQKKRRGGRGRGREAHSHAADRDAV